MLFKVNDLFYECETTDSRTGFAHRIRIKNRFGETLVESRTHYYNRTWECYNYQTAMRAAQEKLKKIIKRCQAGRDFINYRWEDFEEYDFSKEPPRGVLA